MKLSYLSFALALPCSLSTSSAIDLRISLSGVSLGPEYVISDPATYGYKGPGVYRILNRLSTKALADDIPGVRASHVITHDKADTNDQKWVVANVGKGEVLIMNNGTGKIMEAIPIPGETVLSAYAPLLLRNCHWKLNSDVFSDLDKPALRIENAALYEFTLDLRDGGLKAGTDVVLSEIDDPDFPGDMLNQAWDVEYLGPI